MKKGINNTGFKALPSSVQNNILSNMKYGGKKYAAGGAMPMEQLTEFNEGGRHEENSLGGIPQGMNPDGQMNLVEEGETKFDAENYIFSDSLKVDKELAEAFNLNPKTVGKTFADASKLAGRKKSKREGDAIEEAANNRDLENLMEAQEAFKQARIEEKLQEIAELDPNALPALMGQGQPQGGPQGDPAMGGQMQEAPVDEQAMMEQQMMAQQGGGGQPSPEEMAMMQQQQDMMMGQQEGMMRAGGKLPKEVLKARVQSHMSPAQADAYVQNYDNGGDLDVKAGQYPMTEEESELRDDYKRAKKYAYEFDLAFNPEKLVRKEPLDWEDVSLEDYRKMVNTPRSKYYYLDMSNAANLAPEAEKLGGYLGDGKGSFSKRSYAPGGFMGMNMANAGMMTPEPCGGPENPCPEEKPMSIRKQNRINKELFEQGRIDDYARDLAHLRKQDGSMTHAAFDSKYSRKDKNYFSKRIPDVLPIYDDATTTDAKFYKSGSGSPVNFNNGGMLTTDPPFKIGSTSYTMDSIPNTKLTPEEARYMSFRTGPSGRRSGAKKAFNSAKQIMTPNDFRSFKQDLAIGNPGLGMRSGGKMCYGCGGAMHNYGGRMNGVQHKYGAGMKTAGTILDTAADFAKYIPVVGQIVAPIAEAGANVLQGAGEAKATDTAYSWKDAAFDAGSGAAGTFVPGAEQAIQAAGDMATKKEKTAEMQKKQEILNDPSHPDHEQVKKAIEDRSTDKSLQNAETFANVWNTTAGVASKFINPGENVDDMGEAVDTLPIEGIETIPEIDSIPDMNFARYGKKLYKDGGHLYNPGGPLRDIPWENRVPSTYAYSTFNDPSTYEVFNTNTFTIDPSMQPNNINIDPSPGFLSNLNLNSPPSTDPMIRPLYDIDKLPVKPATYSTPGSNRQTIISEQNTTPQNTTPEQNTTNDDGTYGGDMDSAFIDMSTSASPTDLISPAYNLGMGLFGKDADTSYNLEKFTSTPFDFTETKNALRRQTAKAINQLGRKGTGNPSNLLALSQIGSKLEADFLQKAQNINIQREQAAADKNTKAKNAYEKEQKELELKEKAVRDELIKAGLKDIQGISDKNRQTEYMFKFMQAMAPDVVKGSYKNMSKMFMDVFKKKQQESKS